MDFLAAVPDRAWDLLANWGPAIVICYFIYRVSGRLAGTVVSEFIASQKEQAKALTDQAVSMKHLAGCIETSIREDREGYKEVILFLKVLRGEVRSLRKRLLEKDGNDNG